MIFAKGQPDLYHVSFLHRSERQGITQLIFGNQLDGLSFKKALRCQLFFQVDFEVVSLVNLPGRSRGGEIPRGDRIEAVDSNDFLHKIHVSLKVHPVARDFPLVISLVNQPEAFKGPVGRINGNSSPNRLMKAVRIEGDFARHFRSNPSKGSGAINDSTRQLGNELQRKRRGFGDPLRIDSSFKPV